MADHFNHFELKQFAATVAQCMEFPLPESYAPAVGWAAEILKTRLGGKADRVVAFHADAVGQYIWQKYTNLFAPVYANTSMALPFLSTVESVTPVAHASMYTGLSPEEHGIQTYVRPQLTCSTLFDELLAAGRKPVIIAQDDSTFLHIFAGRDMPYFECPNALSVIEKAIGVIESGEYDFVSIHAFDYDNAAHAFGPESKQGLNAVSLEAEGFDRIAAAVRRAWKGQRTLLTYSPDHGQHLTAGGTGSHGSKMIEDMNILHFFGTVRGDETGADM